MSSDFYRRNLNQKPKYKVGDRVRVPLKQDPKFPVSKLQFRKGFQPKWSDEVYKISDVQYNGVWFYKVLPLRGGLQYVAMNERDPRALFYYEKEIIKVLN
jgi:hypothetical protein